MTAATAIQLPAVREPVRLAGHRTYRKQILPGSTVDHPSLGRVELDLAGLVERFDAGALDVVPFTLTDAQNRHVDDVERVRGEVKRLEREGEAVYAVIETTDRGAELIAEQPRLPVSVRVKVPETGRFAGQQVLAHVAGTLDPVVVGMEPWQPVEASSGGTVLDFSNATWVGSEQAERMALVRAWAEDYDGRPRSQPIEFATSREPVDAEAKRRQELLGAWESFVG